MKLVSYIIIGEKMPKINTSKKEQEGFVTIEQKQSEIIVTFNRFTKI